MNDCPRQNPAYGRLSLSLYKSKSYNLTGQVEFNGSSGFALSTRKYAENQYCRRLATRN